MTSIKSKPKVMVSQAIGTELRNVTKDIVYKNEHGLGVLRHQEIQGETLMIKLETKHC